MDDQDTPDTSLQRLLAQALQAPSPPLLPTTIMATPTNRPSPADIARLQNLDPEDAEVTEPLATSNHLPLFPLNMIASQIIVPDPTKPPQDEDFYQRMHKNERNMNWYAPRIRDALGVTQEIYNVILASADQFLPGEEAVNFRDVAGRTIRDNAADELANDRNMQQYISKSFDISKYPAANEFFIKVPGKLIMAANDTRRARGASTVAAPTKRSFDDYDGADLTMTDDADFTPPVAKQPRVLKRSTRISAQNALNRMAEEQPSLESPNSDSMLSTAPSSLPNHRSPHIHRSSAVTAQEQGDHFTLTTATNNNAVTAPDPAKKTQLPYTLQITSPKHAHTLPVGLRDLFSPGSTSANLSDFTIAPIRARYNTFRRRKGVDELEEEECWFKYEWEDEGSIKEMGMSSVDVFDDASLRYAYRIWAATERVFEPFVLVVDEE
jgi:hypothetical protein